MNTILCTYPRTGSRFLGALLRHNTNLEFYESHNHKDCPRYKNIITIVRDPIDTFVSQIILEIECQKELNKETGTNDINNHLKGKDGELDYGKCIGASKSLFLEFYSNVIRFYGGTVLNFDDITNKEVVLEKIQKLSEKFNFEIFNNTLDYNFDLPAPELNVDLDIFNSAKKSDKYNEVLDYVNSKKHLITDITSIYQKIKSSYCI